jgi:hypothetical protein
VENFNSANEQEQFCSKSVVGENQNEASERWKIIHCIQEQLA